MGKKKKKTPPTSLPDLPVDKRGRRAMAAALAALPPVGRPIDPHAWDSPTALRRTIAQAVVTNERDDPADLAARVLLNDAGLPVEAAPTQPAWVQAAGAMSDDETAALPSLLDLTNSMEEQDLVELVETDGRGFLTVDEALAMLGDGGHPAAPPPPASSTQVNPDERQLLNNLWAASNLGKDTE